MTPAPGLYRNGYFGTLLVAVLVSVLAVVAIVQPRTMQHPLLQIETVVSLGSEGGQSPLRLTMLMDGQPGAERCERMIASMASSILSVCPQCRTVTRTCLSALTPEQQNILSERALPVDSARLPNGVTLYESVNPKLARLTCEASERQSAGHVPITCNPAGSARPVAQDGGADRSAHFLAFSFGLLAAAFFASWLVCWLILRFEHLHAHLSHDPVDGGPQKFHITPTARVGGVPLMCALVAAAGASLLLQPWYRVNPSDMGYLLIAATPAFLGGLTEDLSKRVGALDRLLLTMASGLLAAWLLGAVLNRLDVPMIDAALSWMPLAILLTAVAVAGVANAINIIDGYNGLAAGYSVIVLAALAAAATLTADWLLLGISLSMIGAVLGFLIWNWPGGKMFLGDGGAYLLGFVIAEISILLVLRNAEISPWFPVLLLIYPIFETLYSICRRRYARGHAVGKPDDLHLHQLLYRWLVDADRPVDQREATTHNSRVAPYYWWLAAALAALGVLLRADTEWLVLCVLLFCVGYCLLYRQLAAQTLRFSG